MGSDHTAFGRARHPFMTGSGGWRAIIGDGFTKANVQLLTAALAWKMKQEGVAQRGFLMGYDRRFLSREAAHWAAEVMAGAGVPCMVVEREAPTPLIMFAVRYYELPCGMAVTASHNPALYNGVKDFVPGGRDALFGGRLPAPNSKTLTGLQNFVLENGCDIGIATDGDADRLGVIDDRGEFLHPNKILVLLYYYLLRYKGWHGAAAGWSAASRAPSPCCGCSAK